MNVGGIDYAQCQYEARNYLGHPLEREEGKSDDGIVLLDFLPSLPLLLPLLHHLLLSVMGTPTPNQQLRHAS